MDCIIVNFPDEVVLYYSFSDVASEDNWAKYVSMLFLITACESTII